MNEYGEKVLKYILVFFLGFFVIGWIFGKLEAGHTVTLTVKLCFGYIVLSAFIGIPLVYRGTIIVLEKISEIIEILVFGCVLLIPIQLSLFVIVWIIIIAIGMTLGNIIAIPMFIYNTVNWIRKR